MKGIFQRLFGSGDPSDKQAIRAAVGSPLEIEPYSHGLVRIPVLDFFGPHTASPNGKFHLIWLDRNPEGTTGGHRFEGHGTWTLLTDGGATLATGRLERPQDGHVADNGTFILSDWMFGDGLNGRLGAFRADGQKLLEREFSANLGSSGISSDGRFAVCQTLHAPGSPDSNRHFLFDLEVGQEIASWMQETGWTNSYEIDSTNRSVVLVGQDEERVGYGFDGEMLDREGWQRARIAIGDIEVIRSVAGSLDQNPSPDLRAALIAGLFPHDQPGDQAMMIGDFQSTQDGFAGRIRTLILDAAVTLVPAPANDSENSPDWRVLLGDADTGIEIGAGWNRTGERAGAYVAVQIDDPAFVQPLRANLLRSMGRHDEHHLLWSRPTHRDRR